MAVRRCENTTDKDAQVSRRWSCTVVAVEIVEIADVDTDADAGALGFCGGD